MAHELSPPCLAALRRQSLALPIGGIKLSVPIHLGPDCGPDGFMVLLTSLLFLLHLVQAASAVDHDTGGQVECAESICQDHGFE